MTVPFTALRLNPARDVLAVTLLGTALVAWRWAQFARCLRIGDELAAAALAFECERPTPGPRVLVIGDSIALGTGAAQPADSIAGLIAQEFPHATIVNRAQNGARTAEALAQLEARGETRFDLVLVNVGGNDILKRTPFRKLPPQIDALLALARRRSDHVIVTTTPNIGLTPLFFAPLSWWLARRSRQLRDLFADAASRHGAHTSTSSTHGPAARSRVSRAATTRAIGCTLPRTAIASSIRRCARQPRSRSCSPANVDLRGGRKWAKPACGRPLDGRVRPRVRGKPLRCCARPDQ